MPAMRDTTAKQGELSEAIRKPTSAVQVQVMAIGPWGEREFQLAKSQVEEAASWQICNDVDEAGGCLEVGETHPELILLAQSLPGRYNQRQIDQLQFLAPLSRVVVVAGTWCEGELRTGTPLQGVLRLYWYEFARWWKTARHRLDAGLCPPWSVPPSSPLSGRWSPQSNKNWATAKGPIAIHASDFSVFESLSAALAAHGFGSIWIRSCKEQTVGQQLTAGVWDGGQLSEAEFQELIEFCRQVRSNGAGVTALLDFPREHHISQLKSAGVSSVLGKPYVVEELLATLC